MSKASELELPHLSLEVNKKNGQANQTFVMICDAILPLVVLFHGLSLHVDLYS